MLKQRCRYPKREDIEMPKPVRTSTVGVAAVADVVRSFRKGKRRCRRAVVGWEMIELGPAKLLHYRHHDVTLLLPPPPIGLSVCIGKKSFSLCGIRTRCFGKMCY